MGIEGRNSIKISPFETYLLPKLLKKTLNLDQRYRLEKFLIYDIPPKPHHSIDTIIILGTTKYIQDFGMRISSAFDYATLYPASEIIITGKGHSPKRKHLFSSPVEAIQMRHEFITKGLNPERIRTEVHSTNTKENIINTIAMLNPNNKNALIITSGYHARRVDLYMKKNLLIHPRKDLTRFPAALLHAR